MAPRASPGLWFLTQVGKANELMGRAVGVLGTKLQNIDGKIGILDFRIFLVVLRYESTCG